MKTALLVLGACALVLLAQTARAADPVSFVKVEAIFKVSCAGCHTGVRHVAFTTADDLKPFVIAGKPEESELYNRLLGNGFPIMPRNAPALSAEKIAVVKNYILGL